MLLLLAGGCARSVVHPPTDFVTGRTYVLKQNVFLYNQASWLDPADYVLAAPQPYSYVPESIDAYERQPKKWRGVKGIVTPGARIRFDHFLKENWESGLCPSVAVIIDGPFANTEVNVRPISHVKSGESGFYVDERYLQAVDQ